MTKLFELNNYPEENFKMYIMKSNFVAITEKVTMELYYDNNCTLTFCLSLKKYSLFFVIIIIKYSPVV